MRRAEHTVVFGMRTPDPASGDQASVSDAAARAGVIVLAMPWVAFGRLRGFGPGFAVTLQRKD